MNLKTFTLAFTLIVAFCFSANGQSPCQYWRSRVDVSVHITEFSQIVDEKNPENIIPAIECLLKLEGNKNMAAFGIDPMPQIKSSNQSGPTSIFSTPTTAEVAALYMISYLYYQKWAHADWVVLVDSKNSQEADSSEDNVRKAHKYYREWFKQVKAIGIVKARELKIEPLKGKDIQWRTGR